MNNKLKIQKPSKRALLQWNTLLHPQNDGKLYGKIGDGERGRKNYVGA